MSFLSIFTGSNSGFIAEKDNIERINGTNFIFNVFLYNGITKVGLKFAAMDMLSIIDDLKYFYSYGKCVFNYNNEPLEAFETLGGTEPGTSTKQFEPYVFRGDGRDLLLVEIMPQLKDNGCLEMSASESEKETWCIKHTFSIYHYEDKTDGTGMKRRTLYFWDRDFQLLKNITLNFSTDALLTNNSTGGKTVNVNSAEIDVSSSTQNNSVYTGDAIKGVLTKALKEEYGIPILFGEWDAGASKINYTSPAQHKAVDDVDFLITYHVSTDDNYNLPCILKKQRYTDKYQLKPINSYYKNGIFGGGFSLLGSLFGGPKLTEDFFIGKLDPGATDNFASTFKSPIGGAGKQNITDYNLIDSYSYQKINSKEVQEYFTSYAVHTNDPRGYFMTDLKNNNYQSIKDLYNKVFVKPMGGSNAMNIPNTTIRETHKNTQHVFVPYSLEEKQRKSFGINRSMLNLFFKNTVVTFNVRGSTIRQTGQFFTINRRDGSSMQSYDNSVLGSYLITYLRHEFKNGTYTNTIMGSKPYSLEQEKFAQAK